MEYELNFYLALALAYFLGCIPSGYLIAKFFLGFDVTKQGSGNVGATNLTRTGGKKAGLATLLIDLAKGALAVFLFQVLNHDSAEHYALLAGLISVFGHIHNIFLKFKGGKGIATHFGVWLVFNPILFLAQALSWIAVFSISRISSLSALTMLLALIIIVYFIYGISPVFYLVLAEVCYIFWQHKANIQRLLKGEEKKLEAKKNR